MSIRGIAAELYRCQSEVHKLEDALISAQPSEKDGLKEKLRVANAELKIMRKMLEGRKEQGTELKKRSKYLL